MALSNLILAEFGTMMSGLVCGAECPGTLLPKLPTMIGKK